MTIPLVRVEHVSKTFTRKLDVAERLVGSLTGAAAPSSVKALDDVSLDIEPGEIVGLVGESGCGKSTLGRILAGIMPQSEGDVQWKGKALDAMPAAELRAARLASQMIFQDPMSSLNPRKTVAQAIGEAPLAHGMVRRAGIDELVIGLMEKVGLDPSYGRRFPHQFSGGQRQRIGIARALAVSPRFLICDESVSALDVSIQAQVLNLFLQLKQDFGLTYMFISHDLGVVKHIADKVAIMYLGRIVESAPAEAFFAAPNHPYTKALLAEMPSVRQRRRVFQPVKGEIPSPLNPPPGCHFHPRCPYAFDRCRVERPALKTIAPGHRSACHLNDPGPLAGAALSIDQQRGN